MPTPPEGLPRLLHGGPPEGLREHLDRLGPIPFRGRPAGGRPAGGGRPGPGQQPGGQHRGRQRGGAAGRGEGMLIDSIDRAGLTGRGGADFPTARKMRAVLASSRAAFSDKGRAVVVANGAESEPISAKDRALLASAPHLVLDGIALAAESVGASEAFLCVDGDNEGLKRQLAEAVEMRQRGGADATTVRIAAVPAGYVASEESALVHLLNGGPALPTFVPPRPFLPRCPPSCRRGRSSRACGAGPRWSATSKRWRTSR